MSKTVGGIEEPMLEEAQKLLGTSTNRDTVNAALREVVRRKMVDEFFENMRARSTEELDAARDRAWQ